MKNYRQDKRMANLFYSVSAAAVVTIWGSTASAQDTVKTDLSEQGFSIVMEDVTQTSEKELSKAVAEPEAVGVPARIDVRFEGISPVRSLKATAQTNRPTYKVGDTVSFSISANYPAFLEKAELRIYEGTQRGERPLEVVSAPVNGDIEWLLPEVGNKELTYVLRVYDEKGRYDETFARSLFVKEIAFKTSNDLGATSDQAASPDQNTIRQRFIPLQGGIITVSGSADADKPVVVMGEGVSTSPSGEFSITRNVPAGTQMVEVEYSSQGEEKSLIRPVEIPTSQWHYVGILDITAGRRLKDEQSENTLGYERDYVDGRVAFYASGKTQSGWAITTSADTGEGDIEDIFRRLDEKDPNAVLDRLSGDDLYPTYGDDSKSYDDTPTSGRIYVRAEKGDTRAMWGDFNADLSSGGLLSNTRSLYGAEVRSALPYRTETGKARLSGVVYAAQPDTLPQTDILRGTGGSIYFLSRRDVNGSSETVSVEVIDPDTGRVISTRALSAGEDYELNYLQGVITLSEPLGFGQSASGLISSAGGDYDVNLVVQYEFTPTTSDIDGFSLGGRAEAWLTDNLRFGVTGMKESTATADQKMVSSDVRFVFGSRSFVEAEVAQTEGPGFGRTVSSDGGLTLTDEAAANGDRARAYRVNSTVDFADLNTDQNGSIDLYFERIEAGFTTLNKSITKDQILVGGKVTATLSTQTMLSVAAENFQQDGGDHKRSAEVIVSQNLSKGWTLDAGVEHQDKKTVSDAEKTGSRTDVSARLNYAPSERVKVWLLGQTTGLGATSRVTYKPTKDREVYVGYSLDPTRTFSGYDLIGQDKGKIVVGSKVKHSEQLNTFAETSHDLFGERYASTKTLGVTYNPSDAWNITGAVESGLVRDSHNGDIDRDAFSLGGSYTLEKKLSSNARLEYRRDRGDGDSQDADTFAARAGFGFTGNVDARLMGSVDALFSNNLDDSFRDGKYVKSSLGYALRPTQDEQLNMLFKYTYLYDLPGADQVNASDEKNGDAQKSHVLSVDVDYDLTQSLTLGGKYGYRTSEVATRGTSDFEASSAHLGIARLSWHLVKNWDAMVEGRIMYDVENETLSKGASFGAYRHIGDNLKLGVGYEWGQVSEDLTDLNYLSSGIFINLIAKI
ncbi:hypothetical protein [Pseudovibrio sp. Tun.PSC04-5.I4]|uniref:hypothetical protein n=1 Tax=Pseudovibrio sp. Tun.PSC04-5.I4 TaxID=1798213 RepID=UPI000885D94A|nr:hypothetical protein [Pseudovibrio sp. Tun.PSC04-5.I4]SDQ20302.1 hypothetical protein SAMN04515695_0453 [Pseudovibrio sp. Tun.PSC04-5.I4]